MTETVKPNLNKKLIAYFLVIAFCLVLGFWAAYEQAQIPSGYVASYSVLAYLFIGGILILFSLISGVGCKLRSRCVLLYGTDGGFRQRTR